MARPTIRVRIAFPNAPFDTNASLTWTDVTSQVRIDPALNGQPIQIRRGRQFELNRVESGTCSFLLDNRDRRFDPDNSGPSAIYWPNVQPVKRVRVEAFASAQWWPLFTGYIEQWQPFYPGVTDALVRVSCVDALKLLGRASITLVELGNNSPTNVIQDALNTAGWPAADRYSGAISSTLIPAQTWTNQSVLSIIQTVAEADGGAFFMEDDGFTSYHDRYWPARNSTSNATFGDSGTEIRYEDITFSYDDTRIINRAEVTRAGGTTQVATDATSIGKYGVRAIQQTNLQLTNDAEALARAQYLITRFAQPLMRVDQLVLNGDLDANAWFQIVARTLDDKITVRRRAPGTGVPSVFERDVRISSMQHSIGLDVWRTTWQLYPDTDSQWWVLQDTVNGILNGTTRLAY